MKLQYLFLVFIISSITAGSHAQIQGRWHSNFQVAGQSLLMDLQIEGIGRDGEIIVSLPDQPKLKPQTMETFRLFSDSLWFQWNMIGLSYTAKLQGDSLVGTMSQSGLSWEAGLAFLFIIRFCEHLRYWAGAKNTCCRLVPM